MRYTPKLLGLEVPCLLNKPRMCTLVKNWKGGPIYGEIRQLTEWGSWVSDVLFQTQENAGVYSVLCFFLQNHSPNDNCLNNMWVLKCTKMKASQLINPVVYTLGVDITAHECSP